MVIRINRAPVLTLWATVVAERFGHDRAAALTFGKAVAGYAAYAKARSLGIVEDSRESPGDRRKRDKAKPETVDVMGKRIPVASTADGVRALDTEGNPIRPAAVEKYLASKFRDGLKDVQAAMVALAKSVPPAELAKCAFGLYEIFRPEIPAGVKGWGAAGELDVERIKSARLGRRAVP